MKRPLVPQEDETALYGRGFQVEGSDDEEELCDGAKKRRLSVDQVRALEKNFEVENKLEPDKKARLAHELGLQPRQVAVWFQNRRARWKTKQLERDYAELKANYDLLRLDFEHMQRDKNDLLRQINELKAKLAEGESLSFSSVKEEPIISDDKINDNHDSKLVSENSDDLPPLIYKNVASTESDSSAVLNDENSPLNSNLLSSNAANNYANEIDQGIMVISSSSSSTLVSSAQLNLSTKCEGFSSIFHHFCNPNPVMKIEESEFDEEPCSRIFTDEQAPSLNWYCSEWN